MATPPFCGVLTDVLGMTGTKFGCGMALCSARTVHLDGVPTHSCITAVDSVGDAAIAWFSTNRWPSRDFAELRAIGAKRDRR